MREALVACPGVKSENVQVDYASKTATVVLDDSGVNPEALLAAVKVLYPDSKLK